jgi:acetyltransferase-like isoleucine patch superfamily enzyme/dTDP-4-dehydrorhamnose 3,5-epimerase-like enzyme
VEEGLSETACGNALILLPQLVKTTNGIPKMGNSSELKPTISPHAYVSELAEIGADCSIDAGAYLPRNVRTGSHVTIGPNVTFEGAGNAASGHDIVVGENVSIGAGAVICAGLTIASGSRVSPGAVVNRSVPQGAIVEGNPAQIVGYVDAQRQPLFPVKQAPDQDEELPVKGVRIVNFPVIPDLRGMLTVGEFEKQIPFVAKRYFMVYGVPNREVRGEHAHLECHQFLICVHGSCTVVADDGYRKAEIMLDSPSKGVYLPPLTWGIQYKYSDDALLLVFASHYYEAEDYVRNYDSFLKIVRHDS